MKPPLEIPVPIKYITEILKSARALSLIPSIKNHRREERKKKKKGWNSISKEKKI